MACPTMLLPVCASLFAAQPVVPLAVEPETEARIADTLPEEFLQSDPEQIAIAKDRLDRMTVAVSIADNGPFKFIIDTASQRTILSKEIASALALDIEDRVQIIALAGTTIVETAMCPA